MKLTKHPEEAHSPLTAYQSEVVEGIREAVEEIKLIKQGRLQGIPAEELLHEL